MQSCFGKWNSFIDVSVNCYSLLSPTLLYKSTLTTCQQRLMNRSNDTYIVVSFDHRSHVARTVVVSEYNDLSR